MAQTFCQRLVESAETHRDKVAMVMIGPDGVESTTYGSMLQHIKNLAFRLGKEGINYGDRVALLGENHPNWVITYLATLYHGAVVVPLDPASSIEALAAFIENSDSKLAFVSPSSLGKFRMVCERLGRFIPAVALRPMPEANGMAHFEDWAQTPITPEFEKAPPPACSEDMAVLVYTSGTTGTPKGVPLLHGNIEAEVEAVQKAMHFTDKEVVLDILPLFHAYSQVVCLWVVTVIGARMVFITELTSSEIERALRIGEITALPGVPRVWYLFHKKVFDAVLAQPAPVRWLFQSLLILNGWLRDWFGINAGRIFFKKVHQAFGGHLKLTVSAGASFDASIAQDFHRLGFTLLQGYGLTETAGAAVVTRFEDNLVGSVGTPLDHAEVKIHQPNSEGIGEVLIRGPIVTPGYYRNPALNQEAFTPDGWFHSGDLGRFDKKGHLFIVGRQKDVIKLPSGKQVFPEDVESHYSHSPLVNELCVLGVTDKTSGLRGAEKLCAVVVPNFDYLKEKHIVNAREAIRFELDNLGRDLPEYQRVHDYIMRSEALPRTTTRKIRRFELRHQIENGGGETHQARKFEQWVFTEAEKVFMKSHAGQAVATAIQRQARDADVIHPQMNLEIDLGLDSLARAETVVNVEQILGIEFEPAEMGTAFTVKELIALAESKTSKGTTTRKGVSGYNWSQILKDLPTDLPEVNSLLKKKSVPAFLWFLFLRLGYLMAKVLLRLEVGGVEFVKQLEPPFLVCPNHQSYLDAFLICACYPFSLLQHIFHVGASEYFSNRLLQGLARSVNIVAIDPDTRLLPAMQAGAIGLNAGKVLNIYPEGQRSFDGELQEFKKGAAILATELNLPIIPIAIDGAFRVWPRNSNRIRLSKVKIRFGEPIDTRDIVPPNTDPEIAYELVTKVLKARIQGMLDQMRASN